MPIEIRELILKVKIETSATKAPDAIDMNALKATVERLCEKEVKRQLQKFKER